MDVWLLSGEERGRGRTKTPRDDNFNEGVKDG